MVPKSYAKLTFGHTKAEAATAALEVQSRCRAAGPCFPGLLLSSLELSDTKVHESYIRVRLGITAHLCEEVAAVERIRHM